MNLIFKLFLSMSFSGALLILALLLGKPFLKDKISWQWQYYIWLVVILRLLIPFGPETNLMGRTYQAVDQDIARSAPFSRQQTLFLDPKDAPYVGFEPDSEDADQPAEALTTAYSFPDSVSPLVRSLRLIWLLVALGMLIRKITVYQSFLRYIHAGLTPVSDLKVLDRLSAAAEQAGIKKPVELCIHPLISSPLLTGFLHPCIVLPDLHISEKDFPYIVLHELTHWRRKDILYKWLVQLTVCLHWFNPLVHLMNREITKACEFSCDEAVLAKAGHDNAQDYGTTLLNAMAAVGKHRETPGTVTLSENKQLLKERICAVMNVRQPSKAAKTGTFILTLCVVFAAAFVGVYTMGTAAAFDHPVENTFSSASDRLVETEDASSSASDRPVEAADAFTEVERYYEEDSLPLFGIAFSRLDESAQKKWLEKLYADDEIAFFSVAVGGLDPASSLFADFAEKIYAEEETAFFSTLADCMDEAKLESWLDRALKDGRWNFQSILYDRLDRGDEFDRLEEKQEKEWEETLRAEYQAAGVTMSGKNYYYQGQLVNVFLDTRANQSFYTLNMNPAGTVNIKIIRDADDKITGAAYLTETEVTELLGDWS